MSGADGAGLGVALAAVLGRTGARVARVVDGGTSAVIAVAGPDAWRDGGVATLAGWAVRVAASEGGLTNLVLITGDGVHLLQPVDPAGALVHLRFDHGQADLAAARAVLAGPDFQAAVRAALHRPAPPAGGTPLASGPRTQVPVPRRAPEPGAAPAGHEASGPRIPGSRLGAPPPAVPAPGTVPDVPAPRSAPAPRTAPPPPQPGAPVRRASSTGVLAVLALEAAVPAPAPVPAVPAQAGPAHAADVPTPPHPMPAVLPLPRRAAARSVLRAAAPLQEAVWSHDDHTLQRVLTGLRNLA